MKPRLFMSVLILALLVTSHAVAQGRGRGGGYGLGAGSTPFGSAMLGMGAATSAAGTYNLNTSQGATYYQQAYQQWMENQKLREQTYFDMRRMSSSYRAEQAMLRPHATHEEVEGFNRSRMPTLLSANEFDPAKGVIEWPGLLTRKEFDGSRAKLEGLFGQAAADPQDAGLGTENYRETQRTISAMEELLRGEITQFKPEEYIPARKFLKSLAFESRTPGGDPVAKK